MPRWLLILGIVLAAVGLAGMLAIPLLFRVLPGQFSGARSLGQRIYLTGVGDDGPIPRSGGFVHHHLSSAGCAACHGPDGSGGAAFGGFGTSVEAPDITYGALTSPHSEDATTEPAWTAGDIAEAIRRGVKPDGRRLSRVMPRWDMSETEMDALIGYLKELDR